MMPTNTVVNGTCLSPRRSGIAWPEASNALKTDCEWHDFGAWRPFAGTLELCVKYCARCKRCKYATYSEQRQECEWSISFDQSRSTHGNVHSISVQILHKDRDAAEYRVRAPPDAIPSAATFAPGPATSLLTAKIYTHHPALRQTVLAAYRTERNYLIELNGLRVPTKL